MCENKVYQRRAWYDAIMAWAKGEPIQFRHRLERGFPGEWTDYTTKFVPSFTSEDYEWRPKPKEIVINGFVQNTIGKLEVLQFPQGSACNTVEFTFDPETNKLINVKLLGEQK